MWGAIAGCEEILLATVELDHLQTKPSPGLISIYTIQYKSMTSALARRTRLFSRPIPLLYISPPVSSFTTGKTKVASQYYCSKSDRTNIMAMEQANRLKNRLDNGEKAWGHWQTLPGTNISRALARSGVDWVLVDCEHGNVDGMTCFSSFN